MFRRDSGFTLIEILVVMLLIAMASALVAPVAYKSVGKFDNLINQAKKADSLKYAQYMSFIKDSKCKNDNNTIICGIEKYVIK